MAANPTSTQSGLITLANRIGFTHRLWPELLGVLLGLVVMAGLTGCVTEVTGNSIEEASESARVKAQIDLARGYLEENSFQRARRPLEKALEIDNRSVEAHVLKAIIHQREEENALAEKHYKLALRYDPTDAQALNNYGGFLYAQGRVEDALVPLRKSVEDTAYSARAQAFVNLGLVESSLDNVDEARSAFERSIMLNDQQPRPHLELADIYFTSGNVMRAADHYGQFRTGARQTPRSLCLGIRIATALQLADEQSSLRMALRNLYPGSEEAESCEAQSGV